MHRRANRGRKRGVISMYNPTDAGSRGVRDQGGGDRKRVSRGSADVSRGSLGTH